jgi:hypothetical protein
VITGLRGDNSWHKAVFTARQEVGMLALILVFILVVIVFGLGFVAKALFWVALVLFILWALGFLVGRRRSRRWYW